MRALVVPYVGSSLHIVVRIDKGCIWAWHGAHCMVHFDKTSAASGRPPPALAPGSLLEAAVKELMHDGMITVASPKLAKLTLM